MRTQWVHCKSVKWALRTMLESYLAALGKSIYGHKGVTLSFPLCVLLEWYQCEFFYGIYSVKFASDTLDVTTYNKHIMAPYCCI